MARDSSSEACVTLKSRKWLSHLSVRLHSMQEKGELCDTLVLTRGGTSVAHSCVLAAGSPLIAGKLSEALFGQKIVSLANVPHPIWKYISDFLYSGQVRIPKVILQQFKDACRYLQVEECVDFNQIECSGQNHSSGDYRRESPRADHSDTFALASSSVESPSGNRPMSATSTPSVELLDSSMDDRQSLYDVMSTSECYLSQDGPPPCEKAHLYHQGATSKVVQERPEADQQPDSLELAGVGFKGEVVEKPDSQADHDMLSRQSYYHGNTEVAIRSTVERADSMAQATQKLLALCSAAVKSEPQEVGMEGQMEIPSSSALQPLSNPKVSPQSYNSGIDGRREGGKRDRQCPFCGGQFSRTNMYYHLRLHAGLHYQCHVCGKKCASKGNLKSHQRVHTGEKHYQCFVCGIRFAHNTTRNHHMDTHPPPFNCIWCGTSFDDVTDFRQHVEKFHKDMSVS